MKNTNKKQEAAILAANTFYHAMHDVADEMSESDFVDFVQEKIIPKIEIPDQFYGSSLLSLIDLVVEVNQSELNHKSQSFESAISRMNEKAVCWLLDHIYTCNQATYVLEHYQKGWKVDPEDLNYAYDSLERDTNELQGWLNHDLHERIQLYRYEIESREVSS